MTTSSRARICKQVYNEKPVKIPLKVEEELVQYICSKTGDEGMQNSKGSKNISIKMLKDVGMTVPKSRETSAVYMQQDRG